MLPPYDWDQDNNATLITPTQYHTGSTSKYSESRKRNKRHIEWGGINKTIHIPR